MNEFSRDLKILRHSAAHLLAHAVVELFPGTKLTIGPATPEGFFYDFLPPRNFKEEDLAAIEARMRYLSDQDYALTHKEISKEEARALYHDNPYKLELINAIPEATVGLSVQGDFHDLCKGGHVRSTGEVRHFKLLSISGAYWRADKNNTPLQRITGTAFFTEEELQTYLKKAEEAAYYDHRKLGRQLDLFSFHEEGIGFPFFHPKGQRIITTLIEYMRNLYREYGYQEIATPTLLSDQLWRQSGHYTHYKDNMYFSQIDDRVYAIKPMNCPGSILVYAARPRSYRELPLRFAEFGKVHRHELSGVLHGLFRVRAFTQDDAHIYCTLEQLESEIKKVLTMVHTVLTKFNFNTVFFALSTKPKKALGNDTLWETATQALKNGLEQVGMPYTVQEGEGAFYGPKIDFGIEDAMGRRWQCSTVQLDFFQAENFDLTYVASTGQKERPVIIHRAIYGSLERFLGILLEHYRGTLPFWLAPVQARILPITQAQHEYAQLVYTAFFDAGIRIELDTSGDPINAQIKAAQLEKIPWMLIVGKKEAENTTVTLRRNDGTQEFGIPLEKIIAHACALYS